MSIRAILLFPFSLVHAFVLCVRHSLYTLGIARSKTSSLPLIRIGNLAMGGTGKTPFTEYILEEFKDDYSLGVVSRGYGRKGKGVHEVALNDSADIAGDEPLQIKEKFPKVPIVLNANRHEAIEALIAKNQHVDVIVLDDAMQHRRLRGGFQILLSDFYNSFEKDWLFPSGYLRDLKSRAHAADAIVLTKIKTDDFDDTKAAWIIEALRKYRKPVFFTGLTYQMPKHIVGQDTRELDKIDQGLLLTGIARSDSLRDYLASKGIELRHLEYADHHDFSRSDFKRIRKEFELLPNDSVIFTTEKDAQRLRTHADFSLINDIPIYSIGIEIHFLRDEERFKSLIRNYVREN